MRTPPALTLTLALAAPTALAQTAAPDGDVNAAAAAFQEGQRAQLAGNQSRAAEFFELADRTAPSAAALRSAIRSRQAANQAERAATLALRARDRDAADAQSAQLAAAVLAELSPRLARVHLACVPACTVAVDRLASGDGSAASHTFFVAPGPREIEARWGSRGARSRSFEGLAGQTTELAFEPPPEAPPPPPPPPRVEAPVARIDQRPPPARRPLPPVVFWAGVGATAVSGALLVWSGLDTLSARDAYVQSPSEAGYNDGVSRQARTDVFIGTTAVLGVATALVGVLLTDWGGPPERAAARTTPLLGAGVGGWTVGVLRSF